jgi:outer membrane protein TolC
LEEDSKRLLIEAVANAYNEVLLEVEKNRIAEADLVFQKKQLKETQIKYEAGAVPLSDVLNFKGKAIDAENNMIIAYYRHRTAKYALADLMGLTEGAISDTVKFPPLKDASETPLIDIGAYLDAALHNRPDLKSYREAVESAEYTMYSRWGAFSPSATLVGSLSYSRNKARIDSRNGRQPDSYDKRYRNRQYSYGVNVNWTLFEGGSRFARLREAQANVADTQYQLAQMWLDVVKDVRNAYDNYNKTIKQLRLFSQALEVQTKIRDLVEEEYKAGNTSLVRLNEAQRDLVQAETDYVSAKINLHNAQAQLGAAINSNDIFFKGAGVKEMAPAQDKNAKPLPDLKVPVADPVKN